MKPSPRAIPYRPSYRLKLLTDHDNGSKLRHKPDLMLAALEADVPGFART